MEMGGEAYRCEALQLLLERRGWWHNKTTKNRKGVRYGDQRETIIESDEERGLLVKKAMWSTVEQGESYRLAENHSGQEGEMERRFEG